MVSTLTCKSLNPTLNQTNFTCMKVILLAYRRWVALPRCTPCVPPPLKLEKSPYDLASWCNIKHHIKQALYISKLSESSSLLLKTCTSWLNNLQNILYTHHSHQIQTSVAAVLLWYLIISFCFVCFILYQRFLYGSIVVYYWHNSYYWCLRFNWRSI